MSREDRIKIFEDTIEFFNTNNTLKNAIQNTKKKTKIIPAAGMRDYPSVARKPFLNNVFVTKHKTLEAAIELHKNYLNKKIAVLNFASATTPGGGVKKGSSAQEESLCRCSTLYPCLDRKVLWDGFYTKNRNNHNPLHTDDIIYTPDVIICKSDDGKYTRLAEKDFITVDVITCAAPNLKENPNNAFNTENAEAVKISDADLFKLHLSRARAILEAAKNNSVRVLVLGAFGCGAFRNKPSIVALAFKEAIKDYYQYFDEIEFAIYCNDYETENYDAFEEEFR